MYPVKLKFIIHSIILDYYHNGLIMLLINHKLLITKLIITAK